MGPTTQFDAEECMSLLDFIDKLGGAVVLAREEVEAADILDLGLRLTNEEKIAFKKLQKAGEFYVPGEYIPSKGEQDAHAEAQQSANEYRHPVAVMQHKGKGLWGWALQYPEDSKSFYNVLLQRGFEVVSICERASS